jgi:hypothetical protein
MPDAGLSSLPVKLNKRLAGEADNEIQTRPTYINFGMLSRAGTDVFMDIGIVPTEDLMAFKERQEINFVVLDRLVMGLETFMLLHDAFRDLHGQLSQAGVLPNEKIINT